MDLEKFFGIRKTFRGHPNTKDPNREDLQKVFHTQQTLRVSSVHRRSSKGFLHTEGFARVFHTQKTLKRYSISRRPKKGIYYTGELRRVFCIQKNFKVYFIHRRPLNGFLGSRGFPFKGSSISRITSKDNLYTEGLFKGFSRAKRARRPSKGLPYLEYFQRIFYTHRTFKGFYGVPKGLPYPKELQVRVYIQKTFKGYFLSKKNFKGYSIPRSLTKCLPYIDNLQMILNTKGLQRVFCTQKISTGLSRRSSKSLRRAFHIQKTSNSPFIS